MNYCHDCSEYALRFDLRKTGQAFELVSRPKDRLFEVTNPATKNKVIVSVENMTTTKDEKTITCKDWAILVKEVLANL